MDNVVAPGSRLDPRRYRRIGSTFLKFGTIGASGLVVNFLALYLFSSFLPLPYLLGAILATQCSTLWNFGLSDRFVFIGVSTQRQTVSRFIQFAALNNAALLARGPMIVVFTEWLHIHYLISNTLSLVVFTVFRFLVADKLIWRTRPGAQPSGAPVGPPAPPQRPTAPPPAPEVGPVRLALRQRRVEITNVIVATPLPVRLTALGTLVIGLPAIVLRVYAIDAVGLNSDEIVYGGQGASIAQDPVLVKYFPVFRAHPLLFQTVLSLVFRDGMSSFAGRLTAAAFGVAAVLVTFLLGRALFGNRVGAISALLLAVMPYHVVVSRQILLDGPMVFFSTLGLYLLARYAESNRASWLYSAAAVFGLMFVTNERSIVLFGGIYGFFAMSSLRFVPVRQLIVSGVVMVMVALPYPLSIKFSGRSSTGEQFLAWQLFRRANHTPDFYFRVLPPALGLSIFLLAVAGLFLGHRRRSWREALLLWWIGVPVFFFQLWNVKGYQYLLPIAPAVAVLAARTLGSLFEAAETFTSRRRWAPLSLAWILLASAVILPARSSWNLIDPNRPVSTVVAGTGGVPGGREAGQWIRENIPEGATLLAVGPSMANIIQFYGDRKAYGLSVSPNPLHRNPVYEPVLNPDFKLRSSEIQYLVWDSFSAGRTTFFSEKLLTFAERYHGRVVHTETITVDDGDGVPTEMPIIVIYEVRP